MLWSEQTLEQIYRTIGERIRARRSELGFSQTQLGQKVSLTRSSIANIEAGRQRPMLHTVMQIADELNLQLQDLLPTVERQGSPLTLAEGDLEGQPASTYQFVQSVVKRAHR